MKNKKSEQIAAKQKHKESIKAQRRNYPSLERPIAKLVEKPSILIVCEGKNTEPSYFNQFRLSSSTVISIGEGYNTTSLVKRAKQLSCKHKYDQIWCVFDKDEFSENDFNKAINDAEKQGFGVAYSNQAFEYWLILHFNDHQGGGMHRKYYNERINKLLQPFNIVYDGKNSKVIEESFFELLEAKDEKTKTKRIDLAIERAKRNYDRFDHINPGKEESTTTVFRLVKELLKYL